MSAIEESVAALQPPPEETAEIDPKAVQTPLEDAPQVIEKMTETDVKAIEEGLQATSLNNTEGIVTTKQAVSQEESADASEAKAEDTPEAPFSPIDEAQDTSETEIPLEEVEASDSDGEGWITPSNLKKHQAKDLTGSGKPQKEAKVMQVAVMTSDFAMQNVLLRMNLNLLSPSLQRISQLKTWVLRCHACFSITKDMNKQFCDRCGGPTLLRASCSTDKDGNFKIHLKKNMQWNTRGNVFSIPKPVAGTSNGKVTPGGGKGGWGQRLILAEDQKEYVQAVTNARRTKQKDLMDEDYLPNILSGDRRGGGGRPKIGAGKNVNGKNRR